MQGDGHSGLRAVVIVRGDEERSQRSTAPPRLEGEQSVQDLGVPPHPVLKLLQRRHSSTAAKYTTQHCTYIYIHCICTRSHDQCVYNVCIQCMYTMYIHCTILTRDFCWCNGWLLAH